MVEPYLLFAHAPADLSELSLEPHPRSHCVKQRRSGPSIESMLHNIKDLTPKNKHETVHRKTSSSTSARCEEMEEKASQWDATGSFARRWLSWQWDMQANRIEGDAQHRSSSNRCAYIILAQPCRSKTADYLYRFISLLHFWIYKEFFLLLDEERMEWGEQKHTETLLI